MTDNEGYRTDIATFKATLPTCAYCVLSPNPVIERELLMLASGLDKELTAIHIECVVPYFEHIGLWERSAWIPSITASDFCHEAHTETVRAG